MQALVKYKCMVQLEQQNVSVNTGVCKRFYHWKCTLVTTGCFEFTISIVAVGKNAGALQSKLFISIGGFDSTYLKLVDFFLEPSTGRVLLITNL